MGNQKQPFAHHWVNQDFSVHPLRLSNILDKLSLRQSAARSGTRKISRLTGAGRHSGEPTNLARFCGLASPRLIPRRAFIRNAPGSVRRTPLVRVRRAACGQNSYTEYFQLLAQGALSVPPAPASLASIEDVVQVAAS